MKKLIGTVAALLLVASAAFAELSMGAWLRTVYLPVAYDGDDVKSGLINSWADDDYRPSRIEFAWVSEDGKAGSAGGITVNGGNNLGAGDNYVMWVKPIDMLRLSFGRWDDASFRGDLCLPSWDWARANTWYVDDEGLTFDKLGEKEGVRIDLTPIENLVLMWNLQYSKGAGQDAYKAFQKQQIAAAYTIENIGKVKLGWNGDESSYDGDAQKLGAINAAFDLTAVENLFVTVGAKINIMNSDYTDANPNANVAKVAAGATYQVTDEFKVFASAAILFYKKHSVSGVDTTKKPCYQFGLGLSYALMDNLTAMADFRFMSGTKTKVDAGGASVETTTDPAFSFMLGVDYAVSSNGSIGIGFQGLIDGNTTKKKPNWLKTAPTEDFSFAVPVKMQVSF